MTILAHIGEKLTIGTALRWARLFGRGAKVRRIQSGWAIVRFDK
jgi:hypothetical protein